MAAATPHQDDALRDLPSRASDTEMTPDAAAVDGDGDSEIGDFAVRASSPASAMFEALDGTEPLRATLATVGVRSRPNTILRSPGPSSSGTSTPDRHLGVRFHDARDDGDSDTDVDASRPETPPVVTMRSVVRKEGEVALVVGGRRFICELKWFLPHPNTMLGRMFGSSLQHNLTRPDEQGDYVITHEVSAAAFQAILNYYKNGRIRCPPNVSESELHDACNFFLIPFSPQSVKCENVASFLHELSNRGAREQFERFLDESIVDAMARSAQLGERECHIVILTQEDTLEWDDEFPPTLGEQYAQVIHSSIIHRFMKSHENRTIAKQILKEKGLKKIKLGIEGFPIFCQKIRHEPNGNKVEAVYQYEQRPFIKLSWEKDEIKSRHVDFQTIRARSLSSTAANVMAAAAP
eukprot:m.292964 g.292964  ORF g.292964 m.292964 type:complete len:408 (-) comp12705_c0_seq1:96-1319(-)